MNTGTSTAQPSGEQADKGPKNPRGPSKKKASPPNGQGGNQKTKAPKQTGPQQVSTKLRGLPRDSPAVRLSKTLSWLLRHGAASEGLPMRPDGYVKVTDLLACPKLKDLTLETLREIVDNDTKSRYHLLSESAGDADKVWWIRANQGHSMKEVKLDLHPILAVSDIPSGLAVHGTTLRAWESIQTQGLSKMNRNHIHLAQGLVGEGVVSGMRNSSQILILIDVQQALDDGIKFFLSANGVVLTEGDKNGFLAPKYFRRVMNGKREPLPGWEGQSGGKVDGPTALSEADWPEMQPATIAHPSSLSV